jgi:hypothetical protein
MTARPKSTAANALVPAEPSPAAVVEALQSAVENGRLSPKFARELLVRLAPPAKAPLARIELPPITDAESFHRACAVVMTATADGRIAPADATQLLRACKLAFDAARIAERTRR